MKVQKYTRNQLEEAIKKSLSWRQVLKNLNPDANYRGSESNLKNRAIKEGIDFSHFPGGKVWNKGKIFGPKRPISDYFNGSPVNSNSFKKRLLKEGYKEHICENCKNIEWLGIKIPLELHHINHNPKDNQLINLKLLCPTCHYLEHNLIKLHTQKKIEKQQSKGDPFWRSLPKFHLRKVERPSYEILKELIENHPMTAIGKMFGVSDNCIRKWLKFYERQN